MERADVLEQWRPCRCCCPADQVPGDGDLGFGGRFDDGKNEEPPRTFYGEASTGDRVECRRVAGYPRRAVVSIRLWA
ncbi:MAG: hypothetical protein ACRCYU_09095 [Nocardioides sp.]